MAFRLGILCSNPNGTFVRDLQRAATKIKHLETRLLHFSDLTTSVGSHPSSSMLQSTSTAAAQVMVPGGSAIDLDALIVRSMPLGSLEQVIFRMDCLQVLQARGVRVINSPRCLEISIDKWLTLHRLAEAGLPVPPTVACQSRDQALQAFEQLGSDVLVKPLFGGEGRGIVRLRHSIRLCDQDMAWRTFSTLEQLGHVIYLQRYLPNPGYDIRVLVVGQEMFAIQRIMASGSYRSNLSLGGRAQDHPLTANQRQMALAAARAVDGYVVGVDLLPTQNSGDVVLEVNAVPGWKGVASVHGVDVAGCLLKSIIDQRPQ